MKLPVEVISLVVKYMERDDLYACALVNKQFHTATLPILWDQPTVDNEVSLMKVASGMLASQHTLGIHVRSLDFGSFITDALFMLFMPHFQHLERLILQNTPLITDRSFQHIPRYCPNLNDFYITHSPITTSSIVALGQHCHRLTSLYILECPHLSCDVFAALVNCPLKSLTIDMSHMGEIGVKQHTMMKTALTLAQLDRLTHLCLADAPTPFIELVATISDAQGNTTWPALDQCIFWGDNTMAEEHAITFIKAHRTLVDMSLGSTVFTDNILYNIATYLPHIQSLVMNSNQNITPHGLQYLTQHCPLLQHLNMY